MSAGEWILFLLVLVVVVVCLGAAVVLYFAFAALKNQAQTTHGPVTEQHAMQLLAQQKQGAPVSQPLDLSVASQVYGIVNSYRSSYRFGSYELAFTLANDQQQPSIHVGAIWVEVRPVAGFVVAELGASTLKITLEDTHYTYTLDGEVIGHSRFSYPGVLSQEVHPEHVFTDPAGKPVFTATRLQSREETYQLLDERQVELGRVKLGTTFRTSHLSATGTGRSRFQIRINELSLEGTTGAWLRFTNGGLDTRTKALMLGHFLKEKVFTYSTRR